MNIKPGKYEAKITNYGVTMNKKNEPQVAVTFSLVGSTEKITWFGGLSTEQQQAITTKNLFTMGATSATIEKVENGPSGGALNGEKTFSLVIEDHEYNGKKYTRVKYINDPANAPQSVAAAPKGSLSSLKGMAASLLAKGEVTEQKPAAPDAGF